MLNKNSGVHFNSALLCTIKGKKPLTVIQRRDCNQRETFSNCCNLWTDFKIFAYLNSRKVFLKTS